MPSSPVSPALHGPRNPFGVAKTSLGGLQLAYRGQQASRLDNWINANVHHWRKDNDLRLALPRGQDEQVDCTIEKVFKTGRLRVSEPDDPFLDYDEEDRFILYLTVSIPSKATDRYIRHSPPAILQRVSYPNPSNVKMDPYVPDWCRAMDVGETRDFKQPRLGICDFLAGLAMSPENREEGLSDALLLWAQANSIVSDTLQKHSNRAQALAQPLPCPIPFKHPTATPLQRPFPTNLRSNQSSFKRHARRAHFFNSPASSVSRVSTDESCASGEEYLSGEAEEEGMDMDAC
ncbi:hypothetical protein D9758_017885 [Tetrapyrgos nigripes]|uniref:Uncharacterized protein n=1 Tax=Tetrapyrgos nigripes TaxID=182062 RepID=A0A8H5FDU6_9AGAR|nr:hypothetical protein D9758_017885 [Tetrapyrgos nigripes]